jgi:hypothetical protein
LMAMATVHVLCSFTLVTYLTNLQSHSMGHAGRAIIEQLQAAMQTLFNLKFLHQQGRRGAQCTGQAVQHRVCLAAAGRMSLHKPEAVQEVRQDLSAGPAAGAAGPVGPSGWYLQRTAVPQCGSLSAVHHM